jgi:FlaA1/EpsC-like NDP-sugar epimerase
MLTSKHFLEQIQSTTIELRKLLDRMSIGHKQFVMTGIDLGLFLISIAAAIGFRGGFDRLGGRLTEYLPSILLLLAIELAVFCRVGIYRQVLRHTGWEFIEIVARSVCLSSLFGCVAILPLPNHLDISIAINHGILTILLVVGSRFAIWSLLNKIDRLNFPPQRHIRAVIYGAGSAGCLLARTLSQESSQKPIGFVDDNPALQGRSVQGLTVYSPKELLRLKSTVGFDEVLLAMPSVEGKRKQNILKQVESIGVPIKTVPTMSEILTGEVSIDRTRKVELEDLLGRKQVSPNMDLLQKDISGKVVMVTGAGGSIGSELCRQIAIQQPKCLLLYELSEFALYQIDLELGENYPELHKVACLGSIGDRQNLDRVLREYRVDTIYHAAAYKHVPMVEANPLAGSINNIGGTLALAECAIAARVGKFVLISTDKAVRPTNIMGTTKRVAELVLQAQAARPYAPTCFTMVRFGNVLGSSGSVIPRFQAQLAEGKPLTVTHRDITRYFMTIPEAATLVIQAGAMAKGGEVFLLDMGEPVRIYDLAEQTIRLSGLEPGRDVEIEITGLRPGEKIYEELLIDCNLAEPTAHPKIFCASEAKLSWEQLSPHLDRLLLSARQSDVDGCVAELQQLVPEYQPTGDYANIMPPPPTVETLKRYHKPTFHTQHVSNNIKKFKS